MTRFLPWALVPITLASCQLVAGIDEKHAPSTAGARDAAIPCTTNQQCIDGNGNDASVCLRATSTCQPLVTSDCPRVIGSVADDDVILFGLIQDLRGANAGTGNARVNSAELAVSDITETARGVPSGAEGPPRPIAIVACSENASLTATPNPDVPGHFLTDTLHVPAIIGAGNSGTTIDLAKNVTLPDGVLLFSPSATSETITALQPPGANPRLVWRTSPSNAIQAKALQLQVNALEATVHAQIGASEKVRLAVVVKGDDFGTGLWLLTQTGLTINGVAVTDPSNTSVLQKQYPAAPTSDDFAKITPLVQSFAPHIVLSIGTGEAISGILEPLEAGWSSSHPTQGRPQWLFTNGGQATQLLADATSDLRTRVRGTVPGSRGTLYDLFVNHYAQVYSDQPPVTFGSAGTYDIVYLLAYAAASALAPSRADSSAPLTGARLVSGLLDVVSNDPTSLRINVGTPDLLHAFQELQSGHKVKFTGASGSLDFDVTVGEAPSDIDIWCISQEGPAVFRSSGVYYAADTGVLTGTFACPKN